MFLGFVLVIVISFLLFSSSFYEGFDGPKIETESEKNAKYIIDNYKAIDKMITDYDKIFDTFKIKNTDT